ncbi:MAG: LysM peptidoglycan-binding domain-containing protein [Thiohalocapsa sp.]
MSAIASVTGPLRGSTTRTPRAPAAVRGGHLLVAAALGSLLAVTVPSHAGAEMPLDDGRPPPARAGTPEAGPESGDDLRARIETLRERLRESEQARQRLARENSVLAEQLGRDDTMGTLAREVGRQSELLEHLAEQLAAGVSRPGIGPDAGGDRTEVDEENARLRAQLRDTQHRLELLIAQFAEAHRLRLAAEREMAAALEHSAELAARLRQRQQAADEALMRADKAEKLYAALEEAHVRIQTENERLGRELALARERQKDALRRIVELDQLLAESARPAREDGGRDSDRLQILDPMPEQRGRRGPVVTGRRLDGAVLDDSPARAGGEVVYRVRADDTLSAISARVYGDPAAWERIYEANRDRLDTPDALAPGMELTIP